MNVQKRFKHLFPRRRRYAGFLDFALIRGKTLYLAGWACDLNHPEIHLHLDVAIGRQHAGETRCSVYRPDLDELGYGDGCHGFQLYLDTAASRVHSLSQISVRIRDTGFSLHCEATTTNFDKLCLPGRGIPAQGIVITAATPFMLSGKVQPGTAVKPPGRVKLVDLKNRVLGTDRVASGQFQIKPELRVDPETELYLLDADNDAPLLESIVYLEDPATGKGVVDVMRSRSVSGWAYRCTLACEPVTVQAFLDARVVGTAIANGFRSDIRSPFANDGFCGYTILLNEMLPEYRTDRVSIRIQESGTLLAPPPERRDGAAAARPVQHVHAAGRDHRKPRRFYGHLEECTRHGFKGWAADASSPGTPAIVDIYLDDAYFASVIPDILRQDANNAIGCAGRFGFYYTLPPGLGLNGNVSVSARFKSNDKALVDSPKTVTFGPPGTRFFDRPAEQPELYVQPETPAPSPAPSVGIVVLTRNGQKHLESLFRSFYEFNTFESFRFYVVDHGSNDDSESLCKRWQKDLPISFYGRGHNYSYSASNNFAARLAREDVLLFLNNDITFHRDILASALSYFRDPEVGIVGIKLLNESSKRAEGDVHESPVQHLGVQFDFTRGNRPFLPYEIPHLPRGSDTAILVPSVTAAFMLVRRKDFLQLNGFDEGYFYGYEDVDFCITFARRTGKQIVCANELSALHKVSSTRGNARPEERRKYANNFVRLKQRIGQSLVREHRSSRSGGVSPLTGRRFRIAFAVSGTSLEIPEGDLFTAYELGLELNRQYGWDIRYLGPDEWYELGEFDAVVAMRQDFDPEKIHDQNPYLIRIAWLRNAFDRWLDSDTLHHFDIVWCASRKALDVARSRTGAYTGLLYIATNPTLFSPGPVDAELASDYCFTGSFFNVSRQIIFDLEPDSVPGKFRVFGSNWGPIAKFRDFAGTHLPYLEVPRAYRSTKLVLDDANHTVKGWGSVNSRVFDAIASGALVITNDQQASLELFHGRLPWYTDARDLSAKIRAYLADGKIRAELVSELRDIVLAEHSYARRARQAYESIRDFDRRTTRIGIVPHPALPGSEILAAEIRDQLGPKRDLVVHVRAPDASHARCASLGDDVTLFLASPGLPVLTPFQPEPHQLNVLLYAGELNQLSPSALLPFEEVITAAGISTGVSAESHCTRVYSVDGPAAAPAKLRYNRPLITQDGLTARNIMRAWSGKLRPLLVHYAGHLREIAGQAPELARSFNDPRNDDPELMMGRPGELATLCFYPDYTKTNPFQTLLYRSFPAGIEARPGTIDSALAMLDRTDRPTVFHLHWTSVIIGDTGDIQVARARVDAFLDKMDRFLGRGGILAWTIHNVISHEAPFPDLEKDLCRALGARAHFVHVFSATAIALLNAQYPVPKEKLLVAHHGNYIGVYPNQVTRTEARQCLGLPEQCRLFVFLGQLRSYKGLDALARAADRIAAQYADAHFVVAGQPFKFEPEQLLAGVTHADRIHIRPEQVPDGQLQWYLNAADFMVLPYKKILTSGTAFLAISFGLPVIAPSIGLLGDVVRNGESGLLYDPDDPASLEQALGSACQLDPDRLTEMRQAALKIAEEHDWQSTSEAIAGHCLLHAYGERRIIEVGDHRHVCYVKKGDTDASRRATVAVVILHYFHLADTVRCASAIRRQRCDELDLYIVSNDENAIAFGTLSRLFPEATVIQSPGNLGYAAGNNLALALVRDAGYEFFWLLNPDTTIPTTLAADLLASARRYPEAAVLGSVIHFDNSTGKIWFAGGEIDTGDGLETIHTGMGSPGDALPAEPFETDYITGASLFARTDLLRSVGFLPEDYFLYFEETDWCLRARSQGHKLMVFPETRLAHHKRSSEKGLPTLAYLYYFTRNRLAFCRRYFPALLERTRQTQEQTIAQWLDMYDRHAPERRHDAERAIRQGIRDAEAGVTGKNPEITT